MSIPILLEGDNMAATLIACRSAGIRKVRHLDLADLFVRQLTEDGRIKVVHVPGEFNTSDLLTKVLPEARLVMLLAIVGMS